MLKVLVRNTLISGVSFGVVGLLGLLIVPAIINAYGVAAFGLIVLVRVFLPTGFLTMIDFGMSENATQIVARARAGVDWKCAGEQLTLLFVGAVLVGLIAATALIFTVPVLGRLFAVGQEHFKSFESMLQVTGVSLVVLFPGMLLEGIVKGFERYPLLRVLEMFGTLGYVLAGFVLIRAGSPFETIAYAFVGAAIVKYVLLFLLVLKPIRASPLRWRGWSQEALREVVTRSRLMLYGRVLGAFQGQFPPIAIGMIIGPAGVGAYDVLVRLPRFAKTVLSLISSAILPVSARIEAVKDRARLQRLGQAGIVLPSAVSFPVLGTAAIFAEDLLRFWVGPTLASYWPWLSLMFIVPALSILLSPSQTALLVRPAFIASANRVLSLQIVVQYAVSLALVTWINERAFIAGQVLATLLFTPFLVRLVLKEYNLDQTFFWRIIGRHAVIIFVLGLLVAVIKTGVGRLSTTSLSLSMLLCSGLSWLLVYLFVLVQDDRAYVRRILREVTSH